MTNRHMNNLLFLALRIYNSMKYRISSSVDKLMNKYILIKNNVHFSEDLLIRGKIFLISEGHLELGCNVVINSSYCANPIGGNTFTSMITNKNGCIKIGNNSGISNTAIVSHKSVSIGENVYIGGDCKIYDTDFHSIYLNERLSSGDTGSSKAVTIGNGAFIGTGVIILKGSVIGENSVIGAGSLVPGTIIPANEIWAGNPVRFIKSIEQ